MNYSSLRAALPQHTFHLCDEHACCCQFMVCELTAVKNAGDRGHTYGNWYGKRFAFSLGATLIPSVSENLMKGLGKLFNSSVKDTEPIKHLTNHPRRQIQVLDLSPHNPANPVASLAVQCLRVHKQES